METVLKKSKITKSIFEQIRPLQRSIDYSLLKSIGWCTYKGHNYFVFSDFNGLLVKCPSFNAVTKYSKDEQIDASGNREEHFFVKIRFIGNFWDFDFSLKTNETAQIELFNNLERLKNEALIIGQFYI